MAIWTLKMTPGARWELPAAAHADTNRCLYFFKGAQASIAGQSVPAGSCVTLAASAFVEIANGDEAAEFLLLQGKPIGQPVTRYGPFVMNTQTEIQQAFDDYRKTQFGGWPWDSEAPVHPREQGRFARHVDGRTETR